MNERIKELADEARIKFSAHWAHQGVDTAVITRLDLKEFAELIVKECVDVCLELQTAYRKERIESDDFATKNMLAEGGLAIAMVRHKMKKHFGVEE